FPLSEIERTTQCRRALEITAEITAPFCDFIVRPFDERMISVSRPNFEPELKNGNENAIVHQARARKLIAWAPIETDTRARSALNPHVTEYKFLFFASTIPTRLNVLPNSFYQSSTCQGPTEPDSFAVQSPVVQEYFPPPETGDKQSSGTARRYTPTPLMFSIKKFFCLCGVSFRDPPLLEHELEALEFHARDEFLKHCAEAHPVPDQGLEPPHLRLKLLLSPPVHPPLAFHSLPDPDLLPLALQSLNWVRLFERCDPQLVVRTTNYSPGDPLSLKLFGLLQDYSTKVRQTLKGPEITVKLATLKGEVRKSRFRSLANLNDNTGRLYARRMVSLFTFLFHALDPTNPPHHLDIPMSQALRERLLVLKAALSAMEPVLDSDIPSQDSDEDSDEDSDDDSGEDSDEHFSHADFNYAENIGDTHSPEAGSLRDAPKLSDTPHLGSTLRFRHLSFEEAKHLSPQTSPGEAYSEAFGALHAALFALLSSYHPKAKQDESACPIQRWIFASSIRIDPDTNRFCGFYLPQRLMRYFGCVFYYSHMCIFNEALLRDGRQEDNFATAGESLLYLLRRHRKPAGTLPFSRLLAMQSKVVAWAHHNPLPINTNFDKRGAIMLEGRELSTSNFSTLLQSAVDQIEDLLVGLPN
ncbi:hypothetical protein SISSUDRAFT_1038529, partial [Sistotremastrum suecicum HHB10207 ss-3]